MKKLFSILLFAVIIFSLTACSNNNDTLGGNTQTTSATPSQTITPAKENKSADNENQPTTEPDSSLDKIDIVQNNKTNVQ